MYNFNSYSSRVGTLLEQIFFNWYNGTTDKFVMLVTMQKPARLQFPVDRAWTAMMTDDAYTWNTLQRRLNSVRLCVFFARCCHSLVAAVVFKYLRRINWNKICRYNYIIVCNGRASVDNLSAAVAVAVTWGVELGRETLWTITSDIFRSTQTGWWMNNDWRDKGIFK